MAVELARTDSGFRTLRGQVISGNDVRGRRARGARHGRGTTSKEREEEREKERERRSGAEHDANFHAARALILIKYVRTRGHGEISGTKGNLYGDAVGFRDKNKRKKGEKRKKKEKKGKGREEKVSAEEYSGHSACLILYPPSLEQPRAVPLSPCCSVLLSLRLFLFRPRGGELISPRGE